MLSRSQRAERIPTNQSRSKAIQRLSLLTQKAPELRQLAAVNGGQEPRVFGGEDAVNLSAVAISGNCPMSGADQLIDHAGQAVVHPLRLVQLDDLQNVGRGDEFDAAVWPATTILAAI